MWYNIIMNCSLFIWIISTFCFIIYIFCSYSILFNNYLLKIRRYCTVYFKLYCYRIRKYNTYFFEGVDYYSMFLPQTKLYDCKNNLVIYLSEYYYKVKLKTRYKTNIKRLNISGTTIFVWCPVVNNTRFKSNALITAMQKIILNVIYA